MKGYNIKVTLERTLYVDDNANIYSECIKPLDALATADKAVRSRGLVIPTLDLKDWSLVNTEYNEIQNSEEIQDSK